MPAVVIEPGDIRPLVPQLDTNVIEVLIEGAMARAVLVAPCIVEDTFPYSAAAKDVIRDVIVRRIKVGTGEVTTEAAGPFSRTIDTRTPWRRTYTKDDVEALRALCRQYRGEVLAGVLPGSQSPTSPIDDQGYRTALHLRKPAS